MCALVCRSHGCRAGISSGRVPWLSEFGKQHAGLERSQHGASAVTGLGGYVHQKEAAFCLLASILKHTSFPRNSCRHSQELEFTGGHCGSPGCAPAPGSQAEQLWVGDGPHLRQSGNRHRDPANCPLQCPPGCVNHLVFTL